MTNKYWEDEFNEYDFDDYKEIYVERERLRQENSVEWWIYIGVDVERHHLSKIGLTSGMLGTRATGTQNPFYSLYFAFKVKHGIGEARLKKLRMQLSLSLKKGINVSHIELLVENLSGLLYLLMRCKLRSNIFFAILPIFRT